MIDKQRLDEELADCSSELLQYIYDSQKELYSEEELEYILKRKEIQLTKEAKEQEELEAEAKKYLPKEIDCPKCGGPNEFKRDTCKFCGATLNKDSYHEHALNLALGIADEVERVSCSSVHRQFCPALRWLDYGRDSYDQRRSCTALGRSQLHRNRHRIRLTVIHGLYDQRKSNAWLKKRPRGNWYSPGPSRPHGRHEITRAGGCQPF